MFQHVLKEPIALKTTEFVRNVVHQLEALLSVLPGSSSAETSPSMQFDLQIKLLGHPSKATLAVAVKAHLWPNEVPAVAHRLRTFCRNENDGECVPVVISPTISGRSAETCQELGLNWVDFAGNCHIQFGDVLIHVEGKPNAHTERRGTSSLYTPRSARVVHAILLEPLKTWKVAEIAERTEVSLGQVSNVRQLLVKNAFAETNGEGLRVIDPKRLLADWATNYNPRRIARHFYSLKRPEYLEKNIASHLPAYALTEFSAADRYAPYTRYQQVSFYLREWNPSHIEALDLRPAESSANVSIYEDADGLLFSESHRGATCSSPISTYLDLTFLGGRGQEAADHLLEKTILPRWE